MSTNSGTNTGERPASPPAARPFGSSDPAKPASAFASPSRSTLPIRDDEDDDDDIVTSTAQPVASAAPPRAPEKTAEQLEAERLASLPPAKPRGTGPLPRQDENNSRFAPSTFGTKPAAAGNPSTSPAERQDRLNAIRSGNMADVKPEDAVDGVERPAASVSSPFNRPGQPAAVKPSSAFDDDDIEDVDDFGDVIDVDDEDDDEEMALSARPATSSPFAGLGKDGEKDTSAERPSAAPSAPRPFNPATTSPSPAQPGAKTAQPAAAFWKQGTDDGTAPVLGTPAAPPPASSFGRPTQPPGVPEPPRAAPAPAASNEPVINTPLPAVPAPKSAGVGMTAPAGAKRRKEWKLPNTSNLLMPGSEQDFDRECLLKRARVIEETLQSFGAPGKVVEVNTGPVITQFGVEPDYLARRGGKKNRVKVSAIAALDKDLQLALGAKVHPYRSACAR